MSTYWCSVSDVRRLCGLSTVPTDPDYVSDDLVEYYLGKACLMVKHDVCVEVVNESLSGLIDGSNTTFDVAHTPIADIDYDGTVTASDLIVYGWGDSDDPLSKTVLEVSTVKPYEGRIILSDAPSSTFEIVTADYCYHMNTIDYTLLGVASGYLAGFLLYTAEYALVPDSFQHGALRLRQVKPFYKMLENYYMMLNLARSKQFSVNRSSEPSLLRRSL